MEEKKMTKKEYFTMLKDIVRGENTDLTAEQSDLLDFLDKQITLIDSKAEKAKERAAEKRAAGDELRAVVQSVLVTDHFQTVDTITSQIQGEDVTKQKIVARLTQLVKDGLAEKTDVKTEDGRSVKAYKLAE